MFIPKDLLLSICYSQWKYLHKKNWEISIPNKQITITDGAGNNISAQKINDIIDVFNG